MARKESNTSTPHVPKLGDRAIVPMGGTKPISMEIVEAGKPKVVLQGENVQLTTTVFKLKPRQPDNPKPQ